MGFVNGTGIEDDIVAQAAKIRTPAGRENESVSMNGWGTDLTLTLDQICKGVRYAIAGYPVSYIYMPYMTKTNSQIGDVWWGMAVGGWPPEHASADAKRMQGAGAGYIGNLVSDCGGDGNAWD